MFSEGGTISGFSHLCYTKFLSYAKSNSLFRVRNHRKVPATLHRCNPDFDPTDYERSASCHFRLQLLKRLDMTSCFRL